MYILKFQQFLATASHSTQTAQTGPRGDCREESVTVLKVDLMPWIFGCRGSKGMGRNLFSMTLPKFPILKLDLVFARHSYANHCNFKERNLLHLCVRKMLPKNPPQNKAIAHFFFLMDFSPSRLGSLLLYRKYLKPMMHITFTLKKIQTQRL